jgi:hypothetical protein
LIKFALKCTACFVLASSCPLLCPAQQPPAGSDPSQQQSQAPAQGQTPPSGQQPAQQPPDKDPIKKSDQPATGQGKVEGTSNDRLFYTLPDFLTLPDTGKLPPLSTKDKFKVVALGTFDPVEYPWWGILSAIGQAHDGDPAFGQGWAAYGKRYGLIMADSTVENFMVGAVFPTMLHQDPRYYQSGRGSFFRRTGYSVSRIFVTRSDSGDTQFNFSEIFGAYAAACVSTYSYHPRSTFLSTPGNPHEFIGSERTFSNTLSTWETQISLDAITLVVKEFWPDIHRKLPHKHKMPATP